MMMQYSGNIYSFIFTFIPLYIQLYTTRIYFSMGNLKCAEMRRKGQNAGNVGL